MHNHQRPVEILNHQLATYFPVQSDYGADFWESVIIALSCMVKRAHTTILYYTFSRAGCTMIVNRRLCCELTFEDLYSWKCIILAGLKVRKKTLLLLPLAVMGGCTAPRCWHLLFSPTAGICLHVSIYTYIMCICTYVYVYMVVMWGCIAPSCCHSVFSLKTGKYIHVHVYINIFLYAYIYICMYIYVNIYIYIFKYTWIYMYVYICVYICIYI